MKAAGSAAYVVIPKEADLQFIQNNTTGSSVLYETLISVCNKELSKLILGQTMTTEAGGSMAQAKVHAEVEKEIHHADKLFVKNILNDKHFSFYPNPANDKLIFDLNNLSSATVKLYDDKGELISKMGNNC